MPAGILMDWAKPVEMFPADDDSSRHCAAASRQRDLAGTGAIDDRVRLETSPSE
jgi:hypothetical protein